jgi:hypothetical protein
MMDEIIDTFAAYRLLTLDHDPGTRNRTVEMAHEAIIREWERLHAWLDESRYDIRQQRLLAVAAAEWEQAEREASYLLRGARLEQFAGWVGETSLALTWNEREFLNNSLKQQSQEEQSERERQAHELALARHAELSQRRAADRLRYLVAALVVFLLVAVGLSLFAFGEQRDAKDAQATSQANVVIAQDSAAQAQELALINGAQAALARDDIETALALAVAANRVESPQQAQRPLEAAYRQAQSTLWRAVSEYPQRGFCPMVHWL